MSSAFPQNCHGTVRGVAANHAHCSLFAESAEGKDGRQREVGQRRLEEVGAFNHALSTIIVSL